MPNGAMAVKHQLKPTIPKHKPAPKLREKMLVLCVDRDNDLGVKTGLIGPVVGRDANLEAAMRLALADPQDTDANSIYDAIKQHDELMDDYDVQLVTLTGDAKQGYIADREISRQLDEILLRFPASQAIFVSDGASDAQVLPIIQSRIKISSVRNVVMKQAKELEKTYFVIFDKLKEPYYARLIFGLPALLLLLLVVSDWLGYGWRLFVAVLGLYLVFKASGFEARTAHFFSEFRISVENFSFMLYIAALPVALVALWMGLSRVLLVAGLGSQDPIELTAWFIRDLIVMLPLAGGLIIFGKAVDAVQAGKHHKVVRHGLYATAVVALWLLLATASDWIIGDLTFADFMLALFFTLILSFSAVLVLKRIRLASLSEMNLKGKKVITELGTYIGDVTKLNKSRETFVVHTPAGIDLDFSFRRIVDVGERVVLSY